MNRKPYPAYRPSGVEWLGEVPEGWEVKRLRYPASINPHPTSGISELESNEVAFLTMALIGDDGTFDQESTMRVDEIGAGYTYFERDDVVIAKITPCFENGKGAHLKGLATRFGYGTTELTVLRSRSSMDQSFLYLLTGLPSFKQQGEASMVGAGGQKRITDDFVRDFLVPIPPLPEQWAIAAFLDSETARLDTLLAKKRRLVELMKERRSAVITRAVTRGLDPTVPMKNSGVEWIGEVPEGWTTNRVGRMIMARIIEIQDGNHGELHPTADDYTSDGIPFLMANDINNGKVDLTSCTFIDPETAGGLRIGFAKTGDVLLTHKGTIGRVGMLGSTTGPYAMLTPQVTYYRCFKTLLPAFLRFAMESKYWQEQLGFLGSVGSTRAYVGIREQRNLFLTYPRSIPEQQAIVAHLDRETAQIDALVAKVEAVIEKLTEYRIALISAAVTGKIDVRDEA